MLIFYCSTMRIDRHTKSKMEDRSITILYLSQIILKRQKKKKLYNYNNTLIIRNDVMFQVALTLFLKSKNIAPQIVNRRVFELLLNKKVIRLTHNSMYCRAGGNNRRI